MSWTQIFWLHLNWLKPNPCPLRSALADCSPPVNYRKLIPSPVKIISMAISLISWVSIHIVPMERKITIYENKYHPIVATLYNKTSCGRNIVELEHNRSQKRNSKNETKIQELTRKIINLTLNTNTRHNNSKGKLALFYYSKCLQVCQAL